MNYIVPAVRKAVLAREDEKKNDEVLILEGKRSMPPAKSEAVSAFHSAVSVPFNVPCHEELVRWDKSAGGASVLGTSCYLCVEEVLGKVDPKTGLFIEAVLRQSGSKEQTVKSKKFSGEHAAGLFFEMLALVADVSGATLTLTLSKKLGVVAIAMSDLLARGASGRDSFSCGGVGLRLSWNIDQNVAVSNNVGTIEKGFEFLMKHPLVVLDVCRF
jgi:hypothetical protein